MYDYSHINLVPSLPLVVLALAILLATQNGK